MVNISSFKKRISFNLAIQINSNQFQTGKVIPTGLKEHIVFSPNKYYVINHNIRD